MNKILISTTLALFVGIFLGESHLERKLHSNKYGLYYGESIKIKKDNKFARYYNTSCKNLVIVGLESSKNDTLAWIRLDSCSWDLLGPHFDTFSQEELEKK